MSKAAVVIGVNETGHLAPLTGAAVGATEFANWASGAGFDVTLLTDDGPNEVVLADIKKAVKDIVDKQTYERLIIFFAGHGFLKTPGVEVWLLSRAAQDVDEAIDVFASSELARNARIPHVIFVSDACRSLAHRMKHFQVRGGSIFPNREPQPPRPPVDLFYAAMPGGESYEIEDAGQAINQYRGIFTEELLKALRGEISDVVLEYSENGAKRFLIPSEKLEPHLETVVPKAAQDHNIKLKQFPEVRAPSRPPLTFAELPSVPQAAAPPVAARPRALRDFAREHEVRLMTDGLFDAELPQGAADPREEAAFHADFDRIRHATGRPAFETDTGFTLNGDRIVQAVVGAIGETQPFEENGFWHVRVDPNPEARSVMIRLPSGYATVLPVIPKFIGAVTVENDQVVNVSYTPSRNTNLYQDEFEHHADEIQRRRAYAAVATRHGVFRMDNANAPFAGEFLRMLKRLDPTLGIYAAYAYAQAGNLEQVRDVLEYMAQDGAIPFDLLVLSQHRGRWSRLRDKARPFCPALTQGWSLCMTDPQSWSKLEALTPELAPSLWTLFRPSGADKVAQMLINGEVK